MSFYSLKGFKPKRVLALELKKSLRR
ncbi:hypothetical protein MY3296_001423 [Beauveria thailandica]